MTSGATRKIEIGCGRKPREGYESCDIRAIPGVDHICEAGKLPFEDGTIDEIYTRHLIEHFTLKEFIEVLAEWNRVLAPGGVLYVITPNLLWHAKQLLEGSHESFYTTQRGQNDRYWAFGSIFGWQQDEHDIHKFGYYYELLKDILYEAGFGDIENRTNTPESIEQAEHHLEVRALKTSSFTEPHNSRFFSHLNVTH